ncbi:hypothetical protein [Thermococcus barophilus]|uniref:Uncharacterized protein n=1 Tax=Thermococcus barophilus TaxID=55802 RepID=A0A0S1XEG9_THEBA|nr:hypothetical protein [Thermococcus barophilus]ALM76203.1 hypothetical protein TBCH5v1_2308 [Thermococcus barophilus]
MIEVLGVILVGGVLLLVAYDALFRPWKFVKTELEDIEKQLELLNGRFARLHAFMIAPWLKGDVEKTKEFLRMRKSLKQRELAIYALLRR